MHLHTGTTRAVSGINHTDDATIYTDFGMTQGGAVRRPVFELQANVFANVRALREALGSVAKELSLADFAEAINQAHAGRQLNSTTIARWESGVEPDLESIAIMAKLAGVTFEQFALGDPSKKAVPRAPKSKFKRVTSADAEKRKRA